MALKILPFSTYSDSSSETAHVKNVHDFLIFYFRSNSEIGSIKFSDLIPIISPSEFGQIFMLIPVLRKDFNWGSESLNTETREQGTFNMI